MEKEAASGTGMDWIKMTERAAWQPRDSAGEVVFNDRLWILGGWFGSYEPAPRDVWKSADGVSWELVTATAPWRHGDLPMTVVFNGRMWFMGGWMEGRLPGHAASNEVWSSVDGERWEQVTSGAGWTPRLAAGIVVFKGKMWILGGIVDYYFGDEKSLRNDVWSSEDGKTWTQETGGAEWAPRAFHQAVVFDGKMWIMGGGNYVPEHHALNDVWCSGDGVHWEEVTPAASWDPRLWFSTVVYRDRMWVIGGWSKAQDNHGDVWYSSDGRHWNELRSEVIWKSRHEHSAWVFKEKIWIAGGYPRPKLSSEVWALEIPENWFDNDDGKENSEHE